MEPVVTESVRERLWNKNYLKVWSANFMLFFSFMLLTPLFPLYLSETFGASRQEIGLVLSGYTITTLLIRPFSGYIVDTYSRKLVLLITYGCFALLFGGYLIAGSLWAFTVVRTLHGFPFGAATVSNSTVAIDVLPSSRRTEGIGYYGLSNNIATAIGPTIALSIFSLVGSFDFLFLLALLIALGGLAINSSLTLKQRPKVARPKLSLDRFFLSNGWSEGLAMVCYAFSYGVLATYIAIYGKEELHETQCAGVFFMLLAIGLILSRLTGSRTLRKGKIIENASIGLVISLLGYFLFATLHSIWAVYVAALIIGLGNGHMFPAFQNMFINLASNEQRGTANSTLLVSWDIGIGLGILVGGFLSEHWGYYSAFWGAWIVNLIGVAFFFLYVRSHYLHNRLR